MHCRICIWNLTQFMGMRKVFAKGIKQANKVMLMFAVAYDLNKYLKFAQKIAASNRKRRAAILSEVKGNNFLINVL